MQAHEVLEVIEAARRAVVSSGLVGMFNGTADALVRTIGSPGVEHHKAHYAANTAKLLQTMQRFAPEPTFTTQQTNFFHALIGTRLGQDAALELERYMGAQLASPNDVAGRLRERATMLETLLRSWKEVAAALTHTTGLQEWVAPDDVAIAVRLLGDDALSSTAELESFARDWGLTFGAVQRASGTSAATIQLRDVRRGSWTLIFVVGGTSAVTVKLAKALLDTYKAALEVRKVGADIELAKAQLRKTNIESLAEVLERLDADPVRDQKIATIADRLVDTLAPSVPAGDSKPEIRNALLACVKRMAAFIANRGRLLLSAGAEDPDVADLSATINIEVEQLEEGARLLQLPPDAGASQTVPPAGPAAIETEPDPDSGT